MGNEAKLHNQKTREMIKKVAIYTILVIISIIWIFPFIYLIMQSFSKEFNDYSFLPGGGFTFDNYIALFTSTEYPFWRWFLNTLIIASITCVFQTIIVLMTSYAFSRLRFKSRKTLMKFMLIIGMFPGFLSMICIYFILDLIGLTGSIFGLILVYVAGSAMNYYIAKGFFDTIPKSLDEAAMIDGASKNTVFWKIIMPLSKPIVVYTILMAFTAPWGDFMLASYIAQGHMDLFNVADGLQGMLTKGNINQNFPIFCAGGVVTSIPIVTLFFCLQSYYVEGVTGGAVKG